MANDDVYVAGVSTERTDGRTPMPPPNGDAAWAALRKLPMPALAQLGCRAWNDPADPSPGDVERFGAKVLMLFPGNWIDAVPEGYEITTINGAVRAFAHAREVGDRREGVLSFGLLVSP
jgi:hypothetical protein